MKCVLFFLFFLCVATFATNKVSFLKIQDTIASHTVKKDTDITYSNTVIADSLSKKVITATADTLPKKIYRKRSIASIMRDSLLQDSLLKDSLAQAYIMVDSIPQYIDTITILSNLTLYHLIPFYIVVQDSIQHMDRYAGERRVQNKENYNIYIYVYIFLFFLAICINIFQALNNKKYTKNTTFKSDIRQFSKLTTYINLISILLEFLLSIGLAIFLALCMQIFSKQVQNFGEIKNFILHTTIACFIFLMIKHLMTSIIQHLFLSKQNRFTVLYFYKNMLIYLTSLLYIATCVAFFINDQSAKIYIINTSIAVAIVIYLYALFNILKNITKLFLPTLIGLLVYLITLEIIPYLLFFKLLYTHRFFIN